MLLIKLPLQFVSQNELAYSVPEFNPRREESHLDEPLLDQLHSACRSMSEKISTCVVSYQILRLLSSIILTIAH